MNKPAPKEPSMDEILSSIRQIIADDDAAGAPRKPTPSIAPNQDVAPRPAAPRIPEPINDALEAIEPLALTPEQILRDEEEPDTGPLSFEAMLADEDINEPAGAPELVDPEDVAFDIEPEPAPRPGPIPVPRSFAPEPKPAPAPLPTFDEPAPRPRAPQSVAEAAPMPDSTLSQDIAEQLLAPTTDAAVRSTFSRLGTLGLGTPGATIEGMLRDMLRPMLKDWLDENLPSVVERMVEKEITRISRGIE